MQQFTYAYLPAVLPRAPRFTNGLASRVVDTIQASGKRRAAIRELAAMDDHALRDIGLSRSQIRSVVDDLLR